MNKLLTCLMLLFGLAFSPLAASASVHVHLTFYELSVEYDGDSLVVTEGDDKTGALFIGLEEYSVKKVDFAFSVTLNLCGNVVPDTYNFTLSGKVYQPGNPPDFANGVLLKGTLQGFSFETSQEPNMGDLNFAFNVTDGLLLPYFGGQVNLEVGFATLNDQAWSFASPFSATADSSSNLYAAAVPEPASLAIWAVMGATGFVVTRRRNRMLRGQRPT